MEYTQLGDRGPRVSRIAFGNWSAGGDWGHVDRDAAIAATREALDLGITLFDTAHAYGFGAAEELAVVRELSEFAAKRNATVAQLAIAWTLAHEAVDVAIVGARSPEQIRQTAPAADLRLSLEDMAQIETILQGEVAVGGPAPEAMPRS